MDSLNFKNMIKEFSNKRPLLLSLNTDQKAAEEMITDVEKYYDIILKESIRFRAEKENSFIQKIKLLGM